MCLGDCDGFRVQAQADLSQPGDVAIAPEDSVNNDFGCVVCGFLQENQLNSSQSQLGVIGGCRGN